MTWLAAKDIVLLGLFSWFIAELRSFKNGVNVSITGLNSTVEKLHGKVLVIIERTAGHEKKIDNLDGRVQFLEFRKGTKK